MDEIKQSLELIASYLLTTYNASDEDKPNYSNREFMNTLIIFQSALVDKMFDAQNFDKMSEEDRLIMANSCGLELRKLIHTYTGLDTHKVEEFV